MELIAPVKNCRGTFVVKLSPHVTSVAGVNVGEAASVILTPLHMWRVADLRGFHWSTREAYEPLQRRACRVEKPRSLIRPHRIGELLQRDKYEERPRAECDRTSTLECIHQALVYFLHLRTIDFLIYTRVIILSVETTEKKKKKKKPLLNTMTTDPRQVIARRKRGCGPHNNGDTNFVA